MRDLFRRLAQTSASTLGSPYAFIGACAILAIWAGSGPLFHFSDTWQLIINTGTTIVTFLMVFLIQNTQNRDSRAIHIKLDELIRAKREARNSLLGLENMSDAEIEILHREFLKLCAEKPTGCQAPGNDRGNSPMGDGAKRE